MGLAVNLDGERIRIVPTRRQPRSLPDRELVMERDKAILQELLKGEKTKADVAKMFGVDRSTVWRIEERVLGRRPAALARVRRWQRPDIRRREPLDAAS